MTSPRVIDNDRDEITVTLDGKEIRGWSYASEAERRTKMLAAREFCEGWYQASRRAAQPAVKALEPFVGFAKEAVERSGDGWVWKSLSRDRICDWFGPSDFGALTHFSAPADCRVILAAVASTPPNLSGEQNVSRSGYTDDIDNWQLIMWRGRVASAIRGKRGQALLREMLEAMDALPEKRLVASALEAEGQFCALGTVGQKRGVDMSELDPEDYETVAAKFGIATPLAQEIFWENDEAWGPGEAPEARFKRMRAWVVSNLKEVPTSPAKQEG